MTLFFGHLTSELSLVEGFPENINGAKVLVYYVLPDPPSISRGHHSACKTTQTLIRAPLESLHCQLSNGARMNVWVFLHAEIWPLEVEGGT